MCRILKCALLALSAVFSQALHSQTIKIAIDAEFGIPSSTSAQAIYNGAQVAVNEINALGGVLGRNLEIVVRDNRGLPARGVNNARELASNPDVVAIMSGKYSPVVVDILPEIHRLKIPLLDPWAAADPITDNGYSPNYVFRLSLRDTLAVQAIAQYATQRGFKRIGLLLANTEWGRSTHRAAEHIVSRSGSQRIVAVEWYNWGDKSLANQYQALRNAGAQAVILAANEIEASLLINELGVLPEDQRLPILAHWGLTGGKFFEMSNGNLPKVDFSVVQTFSFINRTDRLALQVLSGLKQITGSDDPRKVFSPVGVAHAYDLVHLLARAIKTAGKAERDSIRDALEQLGPYSGLTRKFNRPFTPKRHDALSLEDVFMARYAPDGALEPLTGRKN